MQNAQKIWRIWIETDQGSVGVSFTSYAGFCQRIEEAHKDWGTEFDMNNYLGARETWSTPPYGYKKKFTTNPKLQHPSGLTVAQWLEDEEVPKEDPVEDIKT